MNASPDVAEDIRVELIQKQSALIEELNRNLALADMRIEELESELATERAGRDG